MHTVKNSVKIDVLWKNIVTMGTPWAEFLWLGVFLCHLYCAKFWSENFFAVLDGMANTEIQKILIFSKKTNCARSAEKILNVVIFLNKILWKMIKKTTKYIEKYPSLNLRNGNAFSVCIKSRNSWKVAILRVFTEHLNMHSLCVFMQDTQSIRILDKSQVRELS